MKVSGSMTWRTDRDFICTTMDQCSQVSGSKISNTDMGRKYGLMELLTMVAINLGRSTDSALLFGQITLNLLENFLMTKFMDVELTSGLTAENSQVNGKIIK